MAYWYVDNAASGTNAGTSWTDAWESPGDVVWGAGGVVAGDTLYISGGSTSKTYTAAADGMLTVGASGSSGNLLTIATGAKAPVTTGHDGTVIFEGSATYHNLIDTSNRDYLVLDGEKSGARNWTIQNSDTGANCSAIFAQSGEHCKYTYLTIDNIGQGIDATFTAYLEISYCAITKILLDNGIRNIVGNAGAAEYGHSSIHHNTIQICYKHIETSPYVCGPDGIQTGLSTDIYDNEFSSLNTEDTTGAQHPDYLQTQGSYLRVWNNEFRNTIDACVDIDANNWGGILNHCWIYNNVLTQDSTIASEDYVASWPAGIRYYNGPSGTINDVLICNNTFVDWNGDGTYGGNGIRLEMNGDEVVTNTLIENNLFYNVARGSYQVLNIDASTGATAADWHMDYNLVNAGSVGVTTVTVDGAEHTQDHPQTGAPTFMSYTATVPANDYHLAEGDTAARGNGVDLSAYFTTDKDGVTRSAWDIGAYEYVSGGTPANPWVMIYG